MPDMRKLRVSCRCELHVYRLAVGCGLMCNRLTVQTMLMFLLAVFYDLEVSSRYTALISCV